MKDKMTENNWNSHAQDVPIGDLKTYVDAVKAAKQKADEWTQVADKLKEQIRQAVVDKAGPWNSVEGKRTTYGTVDGKRVCNLSEYEQEFFDKIKCRENHPDIIEAHTTKKPQTRFTI